jgi:hypothetical protein
MPDGELSTKTPCMGVSSYRTGWQAVELSSHQANVGKSRKGGLHGGVVTTECQLVRLMMKEVVAMK